MKPVFTKSLVASPRQLFDRRSIWMGHQKTIKGARRTELEQQSTLLHSPDIDSLVSTERKMNRLAAIISLLFALFGAVDAFAPVHSAFGASRVAPSSPQNLDQPAALQRQRQSMAQVQTMGLFGLGAPEIGVIIVAAAFLLGPEKLAEFGKDAGKIAGELKEVPKEFQKGMEEGEAQAKVVKSKIELEAQDKAE